MALFLFWLWIHLRHVDRNKISKLILPEYLPRGHVKVVDEKLNRRLMALQVHFKVYHSIFDELNRLLLPEFELRVKVVFAQDEPVGSEAKRLHELVGLSEVFMSVDILKLWPQFPKFVRPTVLHPLQALSQDQKSLMIHVIGKYRAQ